MNSVSRYYTSSIGTTALETITQLSVVCKVTIKNNMWLGTKDLDAEQQHHRIQTLVLLNGER